MGNTGEDTVKRSTQTMGNTIVAILLGGTIGLVALLLLTLLTAALVWSGALPPSMACILRTGFAGVCAFVAGRIAVQKGRGTAMPLGGGVGSLLCAVLLVICFSTTGVDGLHGQFLGILLMLLAGGCGHTDGKPQIDKTNHLKEAYEFGKNIYSES